MYSLYTVAKVATLLQKSCYIASFITSAIFIFTKAISIFWLCNVTLLVHNYDITTKVILDIGHHFFPFFIINASSHLTISYTVHTLRVSALVGTAIITIIWRDGYNYQRCWCCWKKMMSYSIGLFITNFFSLHCFQNASSFWVLWDNNGKRICRKAFRHGNVHSLPQWIIYQSTYYLPIMQKA